MEEYLNFAKSIAQESAEIALKYFGFELENTWKEDTTPLTKADTEINDLVLNRINTKYPEDSIYSEEGSDIKTGSKYIWVCDPIDGTMAFSVGLPMFVFSLALVEQSSGQPILGLVNDPMMKNMYWAYQGSGAYRNGKKIEVSKVNSFSKTTYSLTGASGKDVGFSNLPFHKLMGEKKSRVMKFPSFVYGAIQVANGKFIGGAFYGKHGYDVAALKIITEEAGGRVTDLNGEERRYDQDGIGCVVSNGILHNEILECVSAGKL
jgi:fructose-1,6-bisphosphatase/inositol monophosphatase family enzyme